MPDQTNGEGHVDELDESQDIDSDDIVAFTDEDGVEHRCVILAVAEVEDADYALLAPIDQLEDDTSEELELFIFAYGEDEDGLETFSYIDNEERYELVRSFFATLMDSEEEE